MLVRKKGASKAIDLQINYSFLLGTWHGLFRTNFLFSEYMENLMSFLYLSYEDPESGIMPSKKSDIFFPFQSVKYDDCNVVFITEFPTSFNKGSGLGVGNKDSLMPYQLTREFYSFRKQVESNLYGGRPLLNMDTTLETSAQNGILYLNTALTCTTKNNRAHVAHWDKFLRYFLEAFDEVTGNKLFVFVGEAAKFADCINPKYNTIFIEENSIDLACENGEYWNTDIFKRTNDWLIENYGLPYSTTNPFI